MDISVMGPTSTEAAKIPELVARIEAAVTRFETKIVCVDDSTDDTPQGIAQVDSRTDKYPLHRKKPAGELSGAVVAGIRKGKRDGVAVMGRDPQHPPKMIPVLVTAGKANGADGVIASRYANGGSSAGRDEWVRAIASLGAKMLALAMFPLKLRLCADPTAGFFAVRRASAEVRLLRPQGLKILLEILARSSLTVVEIAFTFVERWAGESKAPRAREVRFLSQLAALRFGCLAGFPVIRGLLCPPDRGRTIAQL